MKNKISLLAFVNQPLPRRAIAEYESVFAAAYGECRFEQFTDSRELFSALAGAFGDSETVVLAAAERHYIEIKKLLFDALRTKTASSDRIAEVLEKADEDIWQALRHRCRRPHIPGHLPRRLYEPQRKRCRR